MSEKKSIQSVERALCILDFICENGNKCRIQDISTSLNLNKSTVHSLVSTLEKKGYLQQDCKSPKYSLGLSVLKLGIIYNKDFLDKEKIHHLLVKLTETLNETSYFAVRIGNEYCYLDSVSPDRNISTNVIIGKFESVFSNSAIAKVFKSYDEGNCTPYELDLEEIEKGLNCIAFPLMINNNLVGSIAISGPASRCNKAFLINTLNIYNESLSYYVL